ncbi:hypothetical protein [Nocardia seriolae]|uniref:hypothetical protein n=1 Tax=Nocardia seriolae TaxID=37332 RepID=UPI00051A725E|nr:hypothetical protein [Nocardia seriolae]
MTTMSRLHQAQVAVLASLAPGGVLSVAAIAQSAELTLCRTRNAVSKLNSRGLIMARRWGGRASWQITDRGRRTLATRGRYHQP